jgi:hypothetical protein
MAWVQKREGTKPELCRTSAELPKGKASFEQQHNSSNNNNNASKSKRSRKKERQARGTERGQKATPSTP